MTLYSDPPPLRAFRYDKPTLLVCWWVTIFCGLMITLRVTGRFIRTERLFREDWIAASAVIPLFLRMGCVHVILTRGTNNADFTDVILTENQIHDKQIASGLVLLSRMLFTATIWILKYAILEFLRRLTGLSWAPAQKLGLEAIRWTLLGSFVGILISDLVECHPFDHYWQVLPDPGGQCRQGYAWLISMGTCNVITDLMLVIFPVVLIMQSHMKVKRKIQLSLLFSLSLSVVAVTLYRVPHVFNAHGSQQTRSLLASVELFFAAASANALVLGSFVRDRGVKKQKFRRASATESFDRSSNPRRPTLHRQWGSDEDLVRDVGLSLDPELRERLPKTTSTTDFKSATAAKESTDNSDATPPPKTSDSIAEGSDTTLLSLSKNTTRRLSFFDVGGLLEDSIDSSSTAGGPARRGSTTSESTQTARQPSPSYAPGPSGFRRGSQALLQDIGGLLSPTSSRTSQAKPKLKPQSRKPSRGTELETITQRRGESRDDGPELMDPGGLLR